MRVWFPEKEDYFLQFTPSSSQIHYTESIPIPESSFKGTSINVPEVPYWWYYKVKQTKADIMNGLYRKKVLYYDTIFEGDHPGQFIKSKNQDGSFIIELEPDKILYGVSPEKVINKIDDIVTIEVLGGTSVTSDLKLEKLEHEHNIIVDDLLERNPDFNLIKNLKEKNIGYVSHLRSILRYQTDEGIDDIVKRVYPNYAISSDGITDWWGSLIGHHIRKLNQTQLWLAIRCGIYNPSSKLHTVRSGVGITLESDPDEEWEELFYKLKWLE